MHFCTLCLTIMIARLALPVSPSQFRGGEVMLTPAEIEIYKAAPSLIDWTPRQIRDHPLLGKLLLAEDQSQLPTVLKRTGQTVTIMFHDFPRITCDEEVGTESYRQRGGFAHYLNRFRYIVIPNPADVIPTFNEYRTDLRGNALNEAKFMGGGYVAGLRNRTQ